MAEKVRELDPQYVMAHLANIEILYLEGKHDEALKAAENAIVSTKDPLYYGIKGFMLGQMKRNEEAVVVIKNYDLCHREQMSRKVY